MTVKLTTEQANQVVTSDHPYTVGRAFGIAKSTVTRLLRGHRSQEMLMKKVSQSEIDRILKPKTDLSKSTASE